MVTQTTVIDQKTQKFVVTPQAPTLYVSGTNLPAITSPSQPFAHAKQTGSGARVFQLTGDGDLRDLEAKAFDAAQALREWYSHSKQQRDSGLGPDLDMVKSFVKRIINGEVEMDGITAWCLLDGDRPSLRTVQEYCASVRDVLLWLADRGLCPAECGREDMNAYKAFLQADGAPEQMELMRARWYGREPRITYQPDWRGPVTAALVLGYRAALRDADKADQAIKNVNGKKSKTLSALADRARANCSAWLATWLAVIATYESNPRRLRFERYTSDTVSLRISLTRNFFKMALSRQCVFENPLLEIKVAKSGTGRAQKIISRFFSDAEILKVLETCQEEKMHSPRAKAAAARDTSMIRLMRNQGLRVSEINALDMGDFNPSVSEAGSLQLQHAKGDTQRAVLLTDKTRASLDKWLAYRALLQPASEALFVTLNHGARPDAVQPGERMNVRAIRDMFDEKQKRVGIKRPGRSVHGLRHAYATRAMMEDQSQLVSLSLSMGHSSVTITQGYVEASQLILKNPATLAEI
jgi:site-specific recombinase XerD